MPVMNSSNIKSVLPLDFQWPVTNPFIFCAHHLDHYPKAKPDMTPDASLSGRNIGSDFTIKDGWRMYHGDKVPGFPVHPHRGFETITIVQNGFVDHSDSHGQAGRYGMGDVQWMTAGSGLQHSEMFPLLNTEDENETELFQVWLNLPSEKKFAQPFFKMLWSEDIPVYEHTDKNGKLIKANIICGELYGVRSISPAPDSWAFDKANNVAIITFTLQEGAEWVLPAASTDATRTLYFHKGNSVSVDGVTVKSGNAIIVNSGSSLTIKSFGEDNYFLLLQGNPIDEPVVQYGPFVMNTRQEIQQAFYDYQQTQFGGWPWPRHDNVHARLKGRFATYKDGTSEER